MNKILMMTLLAAALAQPLLAKGKKHAAPEAAPTAQATLAPTPSAMAGPLAPPWDHVALKDGQEADGKIRGYDAYFLSFELKNANKVQIPWIEVAALKPAEFSGDTALMTQYLKNEPAEVQSRIQAKGGMHAFEKALWPGFAVHGYGFKEAGNNDMFLSLAGAELFGVLVGGFGFSNANSDNVSDGVDRADALALGWSGVGIFALTWIVDLAGADASANNFNERNKLSFDMKPVDHGSVVTASLRF
jgi:hypothetical protein